MQLLSIGRLWRLRLLLRNLKPTVGATWSLTTLRHAHQQHPNILENKETENRSAKVKFENNPESMKAVRSYICKGARITHLHLCCIPPISIRRIKFHQPRRSNIPSFRNCHVVAYKFHALSRCHVTSIQMATAIVILRKQNKLPSMQRRQTSSSIPNVQTKPEHMHALQNVLVFLILSYSNVYVCAKHCPSTTVVP